jgi:HEAT repeat protein
MAESTRKITADIDAALEPLRTYNRGSCRADLLPLDAAVTNSANNPAARAQLEQKLVRLLTSGLSEAAQEYACAKLAMIGSAASSSEVAKLLGNPRISADARSALEAIPDETAGKALARAISTLTGAELAGAVRSLGTRQDVKAERALSKLLRHSDARVAAAAAAALGEIGTAHAAKVLIAYCESAPETLRTQTADACLKCAEARSKAGDNSSAHALIRRLQTEKMPGHVRDAAARLGGHA